MENNFRNCLIYRENRLNIIPLKAEKVKGREIRKSKSSYSNCYINKKIVFGLSSYDIDS